MSGEIRLREVQEGDLPVLFEHQRDPQATRMAAFPARTRDAFEAHWRKILADPLCITRTVLYEEEVAGNVGSWEQADERLVGYWIGREFWGRGIATAALAQFLGIVTRRPLHARVAAHNVGSLRVLQKCGFKIVGEEEGLPEEQGGEGIREYLTVLE